MKMTIQQLQDKLEFEGIEYFFIHYVSLDRLPDDEELLKAVKEYRAAYNNLERALNNLGIETEII